MACLLMLVTELIQVFHRRVIHHMSSQDDHEVVPVTGKSLELRVKFHQIHAAERREVDFVGVFHILRCDAHNGCISSSPGAPVSNSDNGISEQLFERSLDTRGEGSNVTGVGLPFKCQRLDQVKTEDENLRHCSGDHSQ